MKRKVLTIGLVLVALILSLVVVPLAEMAGTSGEPPTQEEVKAAIEEGVEWLAGQQDDDGFWGHWEECAVTALAVKKLEHHAVDPQWGLGLDSPFNDANPYKDNIERGLNWLLEECVSTMDIEPQPAGDPDTDGDGIGVRFGWGTYHTSIALMAICEAVELDREVESGPLAGWTYEEVAQDTVDYLAFGQNDAGWERGGWGYGDNDMGWSDQSNSGYAALGLGFAEAAPPDGCGFEVPGFVKNELEVWIGSIQNTDGGSGYTPGGGSNILRTGNLLQQMAFVGDTAETDRVQDALGYMADAWHEDNDDPGWRGPGWSTGVAGYQATFTAMKGFTSLGLYHEFEDPETGEPIPWQADFETVLLAEQNDDGSWPQTYWDWGPPEDPPILSTIWALLTLQKVAPPGDIPVPVDVKPGSCPNPFNIKSKGVLPVAVLGTEDFDVTTIDPATVQLTREGYDGVSPLRWDYEDVATPFEGDLCECHDLNGDGYMDLTLKFETQKVRDTLDLEAEAGNTIPLLVTGNLKEEAGGTPIKGSDCVWVLKTGKK